jgi:hypothetical protein
VGEFIGNLKGKGLILLEVKNDFSFDDDMLLMRREGIYALDCVFYGADSQQLLVAPGSGYHVWFQLPDEIKPHYGFLLKQQKVQAKTSCGDTLCQCGYRLSV